MKPIINPFNGPQKTPDPQINTSRYETPTPKAPRPSQPLIQDKQPADIDRNKRKGYESNNDRDYESDPDEDDEDNGSIFYLDTRALESPGPPKSKQAKMPSETSLISQPDTTLDYLRRSAKNVDRLNDDSEQKEDVDEDTNPSDNEDESDEDEDRDVSEDEEADIDVALSRLVLLGQTNKKFPANQDLSLVNTQHMKKCEHAPEWEAAAIFGMTPPLPSDQPVVVVTGMVPKLWQYQWLGIFVALKKMFEPQNGLIIGDEPGMGKVNPPGISTDSNIQLTLSVPRLL